MTTSPFFHEASGAVRFWIVASDGSVMGATITKETLHYRFQGNLNGENAVETYIAHREEINEAVQRRIARGSIEPVMLRDADVPASPRLAQQN
jgi:uncharacterized protein DUF1488